MTFFLLELRQMNSYVLGFQEIDKTKIALVGGKGANLGELSRIEGISVPDGFCVTTEAYKSVVGQIPEFGALLDQLALLTVEDAERVREISRKLRDAIERTPLGKEVAEAVADQSAKTRRARSLRCAFQCHGGRFANGVVRGTAGHVFEHQR